MTIAVANVANTNTFEYWKNRTNELAAAMSLYVITTNSNNTTGNAYVNGTFSATTLTANGSLRGGNVTTSAVLTVTSNIAVTGTRITVGNTTVNTVSNSSVFGIYTASDATALSMSSLLLSNTTTNTVVNTTTFAITSAADYLIANSTTVGWGNTTSNTTVTTTNLTIANPTSSLDANTTSISVGNSTVNATLSTTSVIPRSINVQTSGTSQQIVDSFAIATTRGGEYMYSITDNGANGYQLGKVLVLFDGSGAVYNEYAVVVSNSTLGIFAANANSTHVRLLVTPTVANTQIKGHRLVVTV